MTLAQLDEAIRKVLEKLQETKGNHEEREG